MQRPRGAGKEGLPLQRLMWTPGVLVKWERVFPESEVLGIEGYL